MSDATSDRQLMYLLFAGMAAAVLFLHIMHGVRYEQYKSQAIERGYALHHPVSGQFIWQCDLDAEADE